MAAAGRVITRNARGQEISSAAVVTPRVRTYSANHLLLLYTGTVLETCTGTVLETWRISTSVYTPGSKLY